MLTIPDLGLRFPSLDIVEEDLAVGAHADECATIGAEPQAVNIPLMPLQARIEFERYTVVEDRTGIIPRSGRPQRPLLPYAHTVDLRSVAAYCPHAVARVGGYAMAIFLFAVAHGDNALAVAVPGQVVNFSAYNGKLALCGAGTCAVPDADGAGDVARCNVVA